MELKLNLKALFASGTVHYPPLLSQFIAPVKGMIIYYVGLYFESSQESPHLRGCQMRSKT